MIDRILVVGATGSVGRQTVAELSRCWPGRILAASRHIEPSGPGGVTAVRLDAADADSVRQVLREQGVGLVVLCVEPSTTGLHQVCAEEGVHLVDIGASASSHAQVERFDGLARLSGACIVLSVGLAPGLTNLLAARAVGRLGPTERVELTVVLGARERHGADAVRWTLEGLAGAGRPGDHGHADLPGFGRRRVAGMPFSDQYSLPRTLGVAQVSTRMTLDSPAAAAVLLGLARSRIGRTLLSSRLGQQLAVSTSGRLPLGSDRFLVQAEAWGPRGRVVVHVSGRGQSRTTGVIAGMVAEHVRHDPRGGVWHIDQVAGLGEVVLDGLRRRDIVVGPNG